MVELNLKDREVFDEEELEKQRKIILDEFIKEIDDSSSFRVELLLLTNYVENVLKDCIVYLTKSLKARKIPRNTINEILLERDIIDKELFDDVKRIFDIRDLFGHNLRISQIKKKAEPILKQMNSAKKMIEADPEWSKLSLEEKLSGVSRGIAFVLDLRFRSLVLNEKKTRRKK